MEAEHELLESTHNTHLMTQQKATQAFEIDRGHREYRKMTIACPASTPENGDSLPGEYSQRKLYEFYGEQAKELDEEMAIQQVRLVRAEENGNITTRDLMLLSIWKNNGVALPALVKTTMGSTPSVLTTESKRSVPIPIPNVQRRPVFRRMRVSMIWVSSMILAVVLIITAVLGAMQSYSSATHSGMANSAVSSIPSVMSKIVPSTTGKHSQSQGTRPSGPTTIPTTTTSPVSPSSDPPPRTSTPRTPVIGPLPTRTSAPRKTPAPGPTPPPRKTPAPGPTPPPRKTPAPGPTPPPRKTPASRTPAPGPALFFGFDGSTQGWGTSEGQYKLAKVSDAHHLVYSGSGSLKVTTALVGNGSPLYPGNSVYTHTEATDYFSPHNFGGASGGATVTCYVYLPPGLAPGGTSPGYIRVFVKDTQYRNDFSDAITIGPSTVGRWVRLSFVIGANLNNEDRGFDATQVSAIGVRIDLNNGSALDYTGPFYIDACSL